MCLLNNFLHVDLCLLVLILDNDNAYLSENQLIPFSKLKTLYLQFSAFKVVIVMGAAATGKSRLSINLATQFTWEVVNADKMQVYEGLDVITSRITE